MKPKTMSYRVQLLCNSCKGRGHILLPGKKGNHSKQPCSTCSGSGWTLNPALIPKVVNITGIPPRFQANNFVYIGRKSWDWKQSKWANPFRMKNQSEAERDRVIALFDKQLDEQPLLLNAIPELIGKILGCWCVPKNCHGFILRDRVIAYLKKCLEKQNRITINIPSKPYLGED